MWAKRIHSSVGQMTLDRRLATEADLAVISQAWTDWAEHPDGWIIIPHSRIVARAKPGLNPRINHQPATARYPNANNTPR